MANLKDIIAFFEKGKTPKYEEFRDSWTSFWHKSEKLPVTQVLGLNDELATKAEKNALAETNYKVSELDRTKASKDELANVVGGLNPMGDALDITDLNTKPSRDKDSYHVLDQLDENGDPYIFRYDAELGEWINTKQVVYKDVAKKQDVQEISLKSKSALSFIPNAYLSFTCNNENVGNLVGDYTLSLMILSQTWDGVIIRKGVAWSIENKDRNLIFKKGAIEKTLPYLNHLQFLTITRKGSETTIYFNGIEVEKIEDLTDAISTEPIEVPKGVGVFSRNILVLFEIYSEWKTFKEHLFAWDKYKKADFILRGSKCVFRMSPLGLSQIGYADEIANVKMTSSEPFNTANLPIGLGIYNNTNVLITEYAQISSNGTIGNNLPSLNTFVTEFIDVSDCASISIYGKPAHSFGCYAFYDKYKNIIEIISNTNSDEIDIEVPNNAMHLRATLLPNGYITLKQTNNKLITIMATQSETIETLQSANIQLTDSVVSLQNDFDVLTDNNNPLFIDQSLAIKLVQDIAPPKIIAVTERIGDFSFKVNPVDIANFTPNTTCFSIAIKTDAGGYKMIGAKCDLESGVFTTIEKLPQSLTEFELSLAGIHLSKTGYKALAEYLADAIERYSYRKNLTFGFISQECKALGQQAINRLTNQLVADFQKATADTATGGWLIPNVLVGGVGVTSDASNQYGDSIFRNKYYISQKGIGRGVILNNISTGFDGFVRIILGESFLHNEGELAVIVTDDKGAEIYNKNLRGENQELIIPITSASKFLSFKFVAASDNITVWGVSSILIYKKRDELVYSILKKEGLKIAYLCDSWGEFPNNIAGDIPVFRANGTQSSGQMYISEHLRKYLSDKGINVATYNNSRGGQTSAWARYWLKELVLDLPEKPDYCVVNFAINDSNSQSHAANGDGTDSNYDFDPNNAMKGLVQSQGGKRGSTTQAEWFDNMNYIIKTLIQNGIKPIVLTAPHYYNCVPYMVDELRMKF